MSLVLGIDPGVSGAIAALREVTRDPDDLCVIDMPVLTLTSGSKKRSTVNALALSDQIDHWCSIYGRPKLCIIEQITTRPGEAPMSAMAIGKNWGIVVGVIAAHRIRMEAVAPAKWKRVMGCTADKDASRARASALMPTWSKTWPLKKHDGRAEAALIACYAQRVLESEQSHGRR